MSQRVQTPASTEKYGGASAFPDASLPFPIISSLTTEPAEVLLSIDYLMALALRLQQLGLSRLRTADWLADVLSGSRFMHTAEGDLIELHDEILDDAYGDDQSFTWNSSVKAFARRRPLRRPKRSMLLRMQLFDLGFKVLGQPIKPPEE